MTQGGINDKAPDAIERSRVRFPVYWWHPA